MMRVAGGCVLVTEVTITPPPGPLDFGVVIRPQKLQLSFLHLESSVRCMCKRAWPNDRRSPLKPLQGQLAHCDMKVPGLDEATS